jgi:PH domain
MLSWMSGGRRSELEETITRSSSLCGYLWKMKRSHQRRMLVPQWNKRWFSIEGRLLKWYNVASSEESSGMVDLRFITNVSAFEAQGVFSFILSYPDRNLLLRASNLSDMNKWIRALQFQADIVRGGCGMTIVTDSNTSGSSPQGKGRAVKEKYKPPTLEANLEAAMVRLQILESRVAYDTAAKSKPERARKDLGREDRERTKDDFTADLRPEDVKLVDSTRDRERERSEKSFRRRQGNDYGRDSRTTSCSEPDRNDDYRHDYKSNEDCDRDGEENTSRESKHAHTTGSSSRGRILDGLDSPYPERDDRDKKGPGDEDRPVSGADEYSSRKLSVGDDSIEEIVPKVRNNARSRCQVNRHRDEREREERERNGAGSNKSNSRSNSGKQATNSDWGYEGEIYSNSREETIKGGLSRRQSMALQAAARASSAGSHRSDMGSGRISHHIQEDDEGPAFDDLPEMDMTVRKPSQRTRDRKQERENVDRANDVRVSPTKAGGNGSGWV